MFIIISIMTRVPLHFAWEVSVCQIGAVLTLRPLPILSELLILEAKQHRSGGQDIPEDGTSHEHLCETERRSLENGTHRHDGCAKYDGILPT